MQSKKIINVFLPAELEPIELTNQLNERIKIRPMYFELGFSSLPNIYGRRILVDNLMRALEHLPLEIGFLVWDVYRPRAVQAKLFHWMQGEIRKKLPQLNEDENYNETCKYMSPPSNVGDVYCPPHLSGGAIDLTLYDTITGNELDMGTPFDDCTDRAHSLHFDQRSDLTEDEKCIRERRNLLRSAMETSGFVSYQYEWWHFDIGNIFWSRKTGQPEAFGSLFGDEEWRPA